MQSCKTKFPNITSKNIAGFTLLETIIGVGLFTIISVSIYFAYSNVLDILIAAQSNIAALTVASNEIEVIRNVPYPDVGLRNGSPLGTLMPTKTVYYSGLPFRVDTVVRNTDNSFDGVLNGNPNDTIPADYKIVEVTVTCTGCARFIPIKITTTVAPRSLESATRNGALLIRVIDGSGVAVSGANVSIINNKVSPAININDTTDVNGDLNFVDIATSSAGYHVSVTKSGFTTDTTYPPAAVGNPNPINPDATVNEQETTKLSFSIDRVSTLNFKATDIFCAPLVNVNVSQTGSKLVGYNPDVYKNSTVFDTDILGQYSNNLIEWDSYDFKNNAVNYDVIGTVPFSPVVINPTETKNVLWVMATKNQSALLVSINDESEAPLNGVTVQLANNAGGFNETKTTGQTVTIETDWSPDNFSSKSIGVNAATPGSITLVASGSSYSWPSAQKLISNTINFGTNNTTFYSLAWNPQSQSAQTGVDSIKFQIASNNDNTTWNFTGPNGSQNTYYTSNGDQIFSGHNGNRYLRYKVFLKTNDYSYTPRLDDLKITFSSTCLSSGQVYFGGLVNGTYTLTISKSGFETNLDSDVQITDQWQEYADTLVTP